MHITLYTCHTGTENLKQVYKICCKNNLNVKDKK